jgi:hypothetical protein
VISRDRRTGLPVILRRSRRAGHPGARIWGICRLFGRSGGNFFDTAIVHVAATSCRYAVSVVRGLPGGAARATLTRPQQQLGASMDHDMAKIRKRICLPGGSRQSPLPASAGQGPGGFISWCPWAPHTAQSSREMHL